MVFANIGDRVSIEPADHPEFILDAAMFAQLLSASADDNLAICARDLLLRKLRQPVAPFRLTLVKSLPIAAGLGGGSSDAGREPVPDARCDGPAVQR
jgi:4-diphosphocytidyl-2-C-methyl-D-erythritol kinase